MTLRGAGMNLYLIALLIHSLNGAALKVKASN